MIDLNKDYINEIKSLIGEDNYIKYLSSLNDKVNRGLVINDKKLINANSVNEFFNNIRKEFDIEDDKNTKYINIKNAENISIGKNISHHQGLIYSQEPSSYEVIKNLELPDNFKFIDLCASPGGKSIDTLLKLNKGFGVLNEIDNKRCNVLKSNIERMGFINTIITNNEPKDFNEYFYGFFDLVILDVPCSGEGMFKKSEEALLNWSIDYIKYIKKIQKEIIDIGIKLLKKDGILVYNTCTFNHLEDEENVEYILNSNKELVLLKQNKLFPHTFKGEGQFYAIFKNGNGIKENDDIYHIDKNNVISGDKYNKVLRSYFKDNIFNDGRLIFKNNYKNEEIYYIDNDSLIDIDMYKDLNVKYLGLYLGYINDNEFIPSNELAHSMKYKEYNNLIEINEKNANKYLLGEVIDVDDSMINMNKDFDFDKKQYVILTYNGIGLGIGRSVNNKIKNLYPKGLRNF